MNLTARTFAVSDVSPATTPLPERCMATVMRIRLGNLESCSDFHQSVVPTRNTLLETVYLAYSGHRPLVLSPDILWVCLLQGLCAHLGREAQQPPGGPALEVRAPDFVPGSLENPWDEVIDHFSRQIRQHVEDPDPEFWTSPFTTTGRVEHLAFQVALMSALQTRFTYEFPCMCGIPSITLEGTPADYLSLRERFEGFREYGLGFWVDSLSPVLEQFEDAARGRFDLAFWQGMYREHPPDHGFGGPYLTFSGWIGKFMPYLWLGDRNPLLDPSARFPRDQRGIYLSDLPLAISRVPIQAGTRRLELFAGLLAAEQDPETLALRPKVGWALREAP